MDASLNTPHEVAALPRGGFLIADTFDNRIRQVDASGTITTSPERVSCASRATTHEAYRGPT